uniref:Uncharacterized protein n=1 Tax=Oryza meridionalis TaxID=40149 RepID=A0A0E0D8R0_9ORYZ
MELYINDKLSYAPTKPNDLVTWKRRNGGRNKHGRGHVKMKVRGQLLPVPELVLLQGTPSAAAPIVFCN